MSDQRQCQCEHIAHFESDKRTPNGNPSHRADSFFHLDFIEPVKTPYGTFHVCRDCANDCYETWRTA